MTTVAELNFLRRVAVAEKPRDEFQALVQEGQSPSSLTSKMTGRVKDLLTIFTTEGGWVGKIRSLKVLNETLPLNGLYEPMAKVLVERLRVERGEIPDPLVAPAPVLTLTKSSTPPPPGGDLLAAAHKWKKEREERSEQWFEEQREEANTEMLHELSVKQLLKLLRQNPKLFPVGEEFEVGAAESGSEVFTLAEYIKGWELEWRSNSADKIAIINLKREIVAVVEDLATGFSKEEKQQLWWAMKGLTHRRRRRRADGFDERIGLDDEILARFEEARAKLPQETKEFWESLPKDEATLRFVSFLRRIRKDPASAKIHGFVEKATEGAIAGVLVFQSEWLDALEEQAKSDRLARIYNGRLAEARGRVHAAALGLWEQVRSQVADDGAPYGLLRKIVRLHQIYTDLPERIRQAVYETKISGDLAEAADLQKKSAEEPTKVFLFPVLAAAFAVANPRIEAVATSPKSSRKSRPEQTRVEKTKTASTSPASKPKEKKYGADLGQPVQKPSASEIALGFNGNRNRGVTQPMSFHTRRRQPQPVPVKQGAATA